MLMEFPPRFKSRILILERFVQICENSGVVSPQLDKSNLINSWDALDNASVSLIVPPCRKKFIHKASCSLQAVNTDHIWKTDSQVQWKFHLAEIQIDSRIVQVDTVYQPLTCSVLYQLGLVVKTCSDQIHSWFIISPQLIAVNSYGTMSANLFKEASLERRLSIVLPEIGLFFPVKGMEF
jgi:hypothetical protein